MESQSFFFVAQLIIQVVDFWCPADRLRTVCVDLDGQQILGRFCGPGWAKLFPPEPTEPT